MVKRSILNSTKKQLKWMLVIAVIAAVIISGLPALGVLETEQTIFFPIAIMLVYAVIMSFRMNYEKGNISQFNLNMYTRVWKDNWPEKTAPSSRRVSIHGLGFLISLILVIFIASTSSQAQSQVNFWMVSLTFFGILFFGANMLVAGIEYALRNKRAGVNTALYQEGMRIRNTFLPWSKIKGVQWSRTDVLNRKTGKTAAAIYAVTGTIGAQNAYNASKGYSLIVERTDEGILITVINDKKGFVSTLSGIGQRNLLEKSVK